MPSGAHHLKSVSDSFTPGNGTCIGNSMDDLELLAEYVRSGSQQHFATLVNRHVHWVYSVCRRQAGDYLAEDVTQAVFATLAHKAARIHPDTSISGWLFKTARYVSATARKIERRRREHERRAAAMYPSQTPPPDDQEWQQILPELDAAVARLPESDRRAILLRFYQGLSHQDAAAILGISPVAAQRRVSRAIEKLRTRLRHFPLIILPGAFEQTLQNHLVSTAPSNVVAASISVASAAPSAHAALIMKGTLIMKYLHTLQLVGIAACLLAVSGTGIWLMLPAPASHPTRVAIQPAQVVKVAQVEFHIVADGITAGTVDLKAMESRLEPGGPGPQPQPGDTIRWIDVEHPEQFDHPGVPRETREWNGGRFLPVLITPDASMDQSSPPGWNFISARPNAQEGRAVAFSFDARGAKLFGDLTTHWYKLASQRKDLPTARARLAIILGDKIISAPRINSPITDGSGLITGGGRGGFTQEEMKRLIDAMDAGAVRPTTEPASPANSGN
jgi:RNA polymerase sigma factor (sigma-70 family)